MQIEYERKFLLTGIPLEAERNWSLYQIYQHYIDNDGDVVRYREQKPHDSSDITYVRTKKTYVDGFTTEEEYEISKTDFDNALRSPNKIGSIFKHRYTMEIDGLTWDIDNYMTVGLVICECEVLLSSSLDENKKLVDNADILMPKFVKDKLLMELTNDKRFSARNLACRQLDPFIRN